MKLEVATSKCGGGKGEEMNAPLTILGKDVRIRVRPQQVHHRKISDLSTNPTAPNAEAGLRCEDFECRWDPSELVEPVIVNQQLPTLTNQGKDTVFRLEMRAARVPFVEVVHQQLPPSRKHAGSPSKYRS
jgi:hypothetical protein